MGTTLSAAWVRRASIGLIGLALATTGAVTGTPAHASTRPGAAAGPVSSTACLIPTGRPTKWRQGADTDSVAPATQARITSIVRTASRAAAARAALDDAEGRPSTAGQFVVPVYIHVIHGKKRSERRITKRKARKMFYTLKAGYAGAQNPAAGPTSFTFRLRKITISRNPRWYHAAPAGAADRQMKARLHRGNARALNIYVNRPTFRGQLLLGYSRFPWQRARAPKQDGVTVNDIALPGGRATGYNQGDTVIHETGHWLGLLHTFEGFSCDGPGDGVADTPAEASPSFTCEEGRNTCDTPVYQNPADPTGPLIDLPDPIHNFMDYSYDYCMNSFTPGQDARMVALYTHFRLGR